MTGVHLAISTSAVIPASVAVPLGGAALLAGFSRFLPRLARDLTAIAIALVTTALTLILMVVSELIASTNGIGYRIQNSQIMFLLTDMWCGIVLLALIGYALNRLFLKVEHHALAWHRSARGRSTP